MNYYLSHTILNDDYTVFNHLLNVSCILFFVFLTKRQGHTEMNEEITFIALSSSRGLLSFYIIHKAILSGRQRRHYYSSFRGEDVKVQRILVISSSLTPSSILFLTFSSF